MYPMGTHRVKAKKRIPSPETVWSRPGVLVRETRHVKRTYYFFNVMQRRRLDVDNRLFGPRGSKFDSRPGWSAFSALEKLFIHIFLGSLWR
ncbi:hypothetical protein ElyMa_005762400 [Elysia marginata]|uniref:Uncharacterized protein n=1 Tax=Elysia marginata TaxID=1093978 RepID=A0AAV4FN67_9GAST|nr:hypothetical protein ElyMa_005762400 [Elysia marginata]